MAVEQISISLSPQAASFIRRKVENGEFADASEFVQDAIGRVQAAEGNEESVLRGLSLGERDAIRANVRQGTGEIENGDCTEYDEAGLNEFFAGVMERGRQRLALMKR